MGGADAASQKMARLGGGYSFSRGESLFLLFSSPPLHSTHHHRIALGRGCDTDREREAVFIHTRSNNPRAE